MTSSLSLTFVSVVIDKAQMFDCLLYKFKMNFKKNLKSEIGTAYSAINIYAAEMKFSLLVSLVTIWNLKV